MLALPLCILAVTLLVVHLVRELYYRRFQQHAALPQLKPSLLFGHMKVVREYLSPYPQDAHQDYAFRDIQEALGNPPVTFLDMRPVTYGICVVNSHEAAERISRASKLQPWSTPKSPTLSGLVYLTGAESLLNKEAEEWKALRRRFNPGFAPQHLITLLPCILDKTDLFLRRLDSFAKTGESFRLDELLINLTFDIIGAVTMDFDFDAQLDHSHQSELIRLFRSLVQSYGLSSRVLFSWREIPLRLCRRRLSKRLDALLQNLIRGKFEEQRRRAGRGGRASRSVLALSFQDTDVLTPRLLTQTCDQIKTFLFAGHDTTSILLQWVLYELSRTPRVLRAMRAELDQLFGPDADPAVVRAQLLASGEELTHRMSYMSAVLKETLRLHPPAGTGRMAPPGTGLTVHIPDKAGGPGQEVCIDGLILYNCASIIHRDRAVYGDTADQFRPERWLGDSDISARTNSGLLPEEKSSGTAARSGTGSGVPPSAWRPFERGPRNCIGQELANLEAKVILACVIRRYDFVKVGLGELDLDDKGQPVLNSEDQYRVKSELYSTSQVTSKPADGTVVKVKFARP